MGTVNIHLTGNNINSDYGMNGSERENRNEKKEGQVKGGTIYAGNIHSMTNDRIEQKREMARKQAAKVLLEQFAADNEVTDDMNALRARNREIKDEITVLAEEKRGFEQQQEDLKQIYGIAPDSEEQKQLDVIRKARNAMKNGGLGSLSKEELEQVANTGALTEYQQRVLEYDEVLEQYDNEMDQLRQEAVVNSRTIEAEKMGLLKTSYKGISAAKKAADTILESASDEIRGMLWEDAKERVDEEMEKLVEAAKEKAQEKEALEEKLEHAKEETKEQEELTETIQEAASRQEQVQGELDKILKEAELLKDELKGLVVDDIL